MNERERGIERRRDLEKQTGGRGKVGREQANKIEIQ